MKSSPPPDSSNCCNMSTVAFLKGYLVPKNPEVHTSYTCKYGKGFPYQVLFTFLLTILAYIL